MSQIPAAAAEREGPGRIPTVDVVRGWLMALIIATHVLGNVDARASDKGFIFVRLLLSGTVGFVTVSGMLVGYFLVTKAADLPRVFHRYAVRAVLLVLLAHPLIAIALHGPSGHRSSLLDFMARSVFVTDVLAFLFLLLVPQTPRLSPRVRLAIGLGLVVGARFVFILPLHDRVWLVVREVLAGLDPREATALLSTYPLASLAGMFLVGSFIGHRYAVARQTGTLQRLAHRFYAAAAALLVVSALLVGAWLLVRRHAGGIQAPLVERFLGPDYASSFYPAYLGGVLVVMALLMGRTVTGRLERFFLVFGRTSLFTYVAQYYLAQTLPWALRWKHRLTPWQAVAYLAVALPLMNVAALTYDRFKAAASSSLSRSPSPSPSGVSPDVPASRNVDRVTR